MICVAFYISAVVVVTGGTFMYFIVFWRKKRSEIRRVKAIHHFYGIE